jgi:hypothetical protein
MRMIKMIQMVQGSKGLTGKIILFYFNIREKIWSLPGHAPLGSEIHIIYIVIKVPDVTNDINT